MKNNRQFIDKMAKMERLWEGWEANAFNVIRAGGRFLIYVKGHVTPCQCHYYAEQAWANVRYDRDNFEVIGIEEALKRKK